MDVTKHKLAEERQRLMVQELHHRVKNSLATVQAIAGLTARTARDIDSFFSSFSSRLQSLSRTHTMLVSSDWQRINIAQLLSSELASFDDATGQRLRCDGPHLDLPSDFALSLGLAIHELTTNAVKHGALSVPQGKVEISWLVEDRGDVNQLRLNWVERGGPSVENPKTRGFGSTLLERIFKGQHDVNADLRFSRAGLEFQLSAPCRKIPQSVVDNVPEEY